MSSIQHMSIKYSTYRIVNNRILCSKTFRNTKKTEMIKNMYIIYDLHVLFNVIVTRTMAWTNKISILHVYKGLQNVYIYYSIR